MPGVTGRQLGLIRVPLAGQASMIWEFTLSIARCREIINGKNSKILEITRAYPTF
jgi:hypothetical protein